VARVINEAAAVGFERGADDYERARPSYPAPMVDRLAELAALGPGGRVLDLAAGTGKLTRLLVPSGADVVALEPVEAMRQKLLDVVPGVEVLDGTAEAIPLPDSSLDAVTVAQAFHWFDAPRSLAEMHRVLRPDGVLFLIWNVRDESVDWVGQFSRLLVERSGGRPYVSYHPGRASSAGEAMAGDHITLVDASGLFGPVSRESFPNPQEVTRDDVVARAASTSFVSALPDDRREALLEEVRELLADHPQLVGQERFTFPHDAWLSWCRPT
jgi:SAM-dependent methyltransferase